MTSDQHIMTGKIHYSLEDPLSHLFYYISDSISPFLYNLNFTPNIITFIRLIIGISAFTYFFKHEMYETASILYLLAFFGDCLDGHFARKYNMETVTGDYLDQFTDATILILSLYYVIPFLLKKSHKNDWIVFLILFFLFISILQIGCQERYIEKNKVTNHSKCLQAFNIKIFCPESIIDDDEIESTMEFTRLFGIGTYHLIMSLIIWHLRFM